MSNAIAERAEPQAQSNVAQHPASADATALIAMIERVALNPDVDIDKMERLLEMQERIMDRNAKSAFTAALAQMQPELPVIDRKGNIVIHKKDAPKTPENVIQSTPYALWEDINDAIRPHLAKYGFALSFRVKKEADRVDVTAILSHRDGHAEETMLSLPMDATGSKNNVQAIGSSTSYGKRYTAGALLNITSRGEDDDGKAAGADELISDKQADDLSDLIDVAVSEIKGTREKFEKRFLAYMKAEKISDIRAKDYERAVTSINSTRPAK